MMEIKNINKIEKNGIRASGTVAMTEEVYINDIAVLEGKNGMYFEMPGQRYKDGEEWKTNYYAVPVSAEARAEIMAAVQEAVDNGKMRAVSTEKRPSLKGYVNIKAKNVSVRVSYTDKGNVITPSRKYEKNGETKYAHYVGLSKEQAEAIAEAFKAALA